VSTPSDQRLSPLAPRAAELRRAFDSSFAEPPPGETAPHEDLLAIRLTGDRYLVRLTEISGVFMDPVVTPVPSPLSELRGFMGLRGAIVPVYALGMLLGYPASDRQRGLLVPVGPAPIGLAIDGFDGHRRLPRDSLVADPTAAGGRSVHLWGAAPLEGSLRPIINLPSVLTAVSERARAAIRKRSDER
jgi:chemotaxis signal transduction protein